MSFDLSLLGQNTTNFAYGGKVCRLAFQAERKMWTTRVKAELTCVSAWNQVDSRTTQFFRGLRPGQEAVEFCPNADLQ